MSALSLCMDRFLQLCSGLEHNHQKVAAGRSVLSLGRGRALRVSVVVTGPFIKNFPCNHSVNINTIIFFFRRSKRQRNF
jgi:hypothetical protein